MPTSPPAFRCSGLRAGYGERHVLHGITLAVPPGQTTVLVGPGGSGKSTLLSILAGSEHRSSLWYEGWISRPLEASTFVAQRCRHALPIRLGPAETAPREPIGSATALGPDTADPRLARLAAITTALGAPASSLLLDEPDAEFDVETGESLAEAIRALRGRTTAIVVTHNLRFARSIADYCVLLVDGAIVEAGVARSFFERPAQARCAEYLRYGS